MVKVLFVCLGNICRSPSAEGVFRALVEDQGLSETIGVDSAGTSSWHIGQQPDSRAQAAARRRGIDLSTLRCRQVKPADFETFDYVIGMDRSNFADLSSLAAGARDRVHMFLDFAPETGVKEVPDPYYGGDGGFDEVLDLIEAASKGLLEDIRQNHL